jgi:hypothetical protein
MNAQGFTAKFKILKFILISVFFFEGGAVSAESFKIKTDNFEQLYIGVHSKSLGKELGTFDVFLNGYLLKEKETATKFIVDNIYLKEGSNTLTIKYTKKLSVDGEFPNLEVASLAQSDPTGEDLLKSSILVFANDPMHMNFSSAFNDKNPLKRKPFNTDTTVEVTLDLSKGIFVKRPNVSELKLSDENKTKINRMISQIQEAFNKKNKELFKKLHQNREKYTELEGSMIKSDVMFDMFTDEGQQYKIANDLKFEVINNRYIHVTANGNGVLYYSEADFSSGLESLVFAMMNGDLVWVK